MSGPDNSRYTTCKERSIQTDHDRISKYILCWNNASRRLLHQPSAASLRSRPAHIATHGDRSIFLLSEKRSIGRDCIDKEFAGVPLSQEDLDPQIQRRRLRNYFFQFGVVSFPDRTIPGLPSVYYGRRDKSLDQRFR